MSEAHDVERPRARTSALAMSPLALVAILAIDPGSADRETAKLEWDKRSVTIEYEPVRDTGGTLADIAVGSSWWFGNSELPVLRLEAPLGVGHLYAPPGDYRVDVFRPRPKEFYLIIEGAGFGITAEPRLAIAISSSMRKDPAKAMQFKWLPRSKTRDTPPTRAVNLVIAYGVEEVECPAVVIGGPRFSTSDWIVDTFAFPADTIQSIHAVGNRAPIATLRPKKPRADSPTGFNVLLGKDDAIVQAAGTAESGSKAAAQAKPPDPKWTKPVTVSRARATKPAKNFTVEKVEKTEHEPLSIRASCGSEAVVLRVPDPFQ